MPLYSNPATFKQVENAAFNVVYKPGTLAPYSGIYACTGCGFEVAANERQPLPTQGHSVHRPPAPILWRLVAIAVHLKN